MTFTLTAAYRRDYDWGARFGEKYAAGDGVFKDDPDYLFPSNDATTGAAIDYFNPAWQLLLPTGTGIAGNALVNGRLCVSPFDTGDSPDCGSDPVGTGKPNRKTPITYTIGDVTVAADAYIPYDNNGNPVAGVTNVPCESPDDSTPDYCSPWSDSYGFFFGDGTTHDVVLTLTEIDYETTSSTGNYLKGVSTFDHTYSNSKLDASNPYIAFFTGGDRISKNADALQNNNSGRFRLETTINIQGSNRSPIATSMPVLPVPYTGRSAQSVYGYMATFQVAAYDPDVTSGVGNEEVKFYLADFMKQGGLMGNAIPEGSYPVNWYKEEYEEERLNALATLCDNDCDNCPVGGGKLWDGEEFNCVDYPPWDNALHLPHSPKYLSIEETTGIVHWETGINPYDTDAGAYGETRAGYGTAGQCPTGSTGSTDGTCDGVSPLPMGFYNLVLDIRSISHDPCFDTSSCTETDLLGHVSVPLDFLIYLYPPMAMCSGDCANNNAGVETFRDSNGLYGHSTVFGDTNYFHNGPGTGSCTICGGGSTETTVFNHTNCVATSEGCISTGCPGYGVDEDGNPAGALAVDENCNAVTASGKVVTSILPAIASCKYNTAPVWVDEATCGSNGVDGNTPCSDDTSTPRVLGKKGQALSFNLVAKDNDDCTELFIYDTGLYTGDTFVVPGTSNYACTATEAQDVSTCPYNMVLGDHERVGIGGQTVQRKFTWGLATTDTQDTDPRPDQLTMCFYAFDNYVQSEFRCIDIILTEEKNVYWRDDRSDLASMDNFSGFTPANNTVFYVATGNKVQFELDAKQGTGYGPIEIEVSQGSMPEGATLSTDVVTPLVQSDPHRKVFSWTPTAGQECMYELCFIAKNSRQDGTDYSMTLGTTATLDERCYTIIVTDTVLEFDGGTFLSIPNVIPQLDDCGMSMGVWFWPHSASGHTSMPLITAGYDLNGIRNIVHQLNWVKDTPEVYNDGSTIHDAGSYYSLQYVDDVQGVDLSSEPIFCSDAWHHAMLTISDDGIVAVYLDGVEKVLFSTKSMNYHQYSSLNTDTYGQDFLAIGSLLETKEGATGFFYVGSLDTSNVYSGYMNDLIIYTRALSASEVKAKMFTQIDKTQEVKLLAYYRFNDMAQYYLDDAYSLGVATPTTGGCTASGTGCGYNLNLNAMEAKGIKVIDETGTYTIDACDTDCTSGTLKVVFKASPIIPACPAAIPSPSVTHATGGTIITQTGYNFANSQFLKCSFGDDVVDATYVSDSSIECVAPGATNAKASTLNVANDGETFSDMYLPVYQMEIGLTLDYSVESFEIKTGSALGGVYAGTSLKNGYTIGFWIMPEVFSATAPLVTFSDGYALQLTASGSFVYGDVLSGGSVTANSWSYVQVSVGADGAGTLMVDGEIVDSATGLVLPTDTSQVSIGNIDTTYTVKYMMDEFVIWTKALAACEGASYMWGKYSKAPFCPVGNGVETAPYVDELIHLHFDDEARVGLTLDGSYLADGVEVSTADPLVFFHNGGISAAAATHTFTTTPFLPPSFIAKKPVSSSCPPAVIAYDSHRGVEFVSQRLYFGPNSAFSFPYTVPTKCGTYNNYLESSTISVDGENETTVYGFGFAPSKFLKCKQGDTVLSATYKNYDEVECDVDYYSHPKKDLVYVSNDADSTCSHEPSYASTTEELIVKESALVFDGVDDFASMAGISSGLNASGVTFGAWFYPSNDHTGVEGAIACFASACNATASPPAETKICAMYQSGKVYLQSDMPDTEYGDLDFSNVTDVGTAAASNEWHYFEISVEPREIDPEIPSDLIYADTGLPKAVTYKASLSVDGTALAGDIRVPALPSSDGIFFVGGMACASSSHAFSRYFTGTIDEVRVFPTANYHTDWFAKLNETALGDVLSYHRLNPDDSITISGATQTFIEAPWENVTLSSIDVTESAMGGNVVATVSGFNVAKSQWLTCAFDTGSGIVESAATYVDGSTLSCTIPAVTSPYPVKVQAGALDSIGDIQIDYKETALEFGGDQAVTSELVGGSANKDATLTLTCPTGLRFDVVEFASYGRPTFGNPTTTTECNETTTTTAFDYSTYVASSTCYTNAADTKEIVGTYCLGKSTCDVPASTSVFGDPCPSLDTWLSASILCTDRHESLDFVEANAVTQSLTNDAYSFGAWVYPRSKTGVQAILAFGSSTTANVMNAGLLQFNSEGSTGYFYYYDDCIHDVAMKQASGENLDVATNKWHHVMVSISDTNEGALYLNGAKTATFSTTCRPKTDGTGTFTIGMDMDDYMYPKEYFDGFIDEVKVYSRAVTDQEMQGDLCFPAADDGLVAYYTFNEGSGSAAINSAGTANGNFATSDETTWDLTTLNYKSSTASPTVHVAYKTVGGPWYPSYIFGISASSGKLGGGASSGDAVTLTGLNFASADIDVTYGGESLAVTYVSDSEVVADLGVAACANSNATMMIKASSKDAVCSSHYGEFEYTQVAEVADIQQGLVCWFPMLDGANDLSGNGKHAQAVGNATVSSDRNGMASAAYSLLSDGYIDASDCVTDAKFVAMWILYEDDEFPRTCSGQLLFEESIGYAGCATNLGASHASLVTNAWKFVAGSADVTYVNGELVTAPSSAYSAPISSFLSTGKIGEGLTVQIDDVWVYDRVLCASEVKMLYEVDAYALKVSRDSADSQVTVATTGIDSPLGSSGLLVQIFGGASSYNYIAPNIYHDWGTTNFLAETWSYNASGYMYAPMSSVYDFFITADDGVELIIDDITVIDNSSYTGATRTTHDSISMEEGWHTIEFLYTDKGDTASILLEFASYDGAVERQVVPTEYFKAGTGPITAAAWVNLDSTDGYYSLFHQESDDPAEPAFAVSVSDGKLSASFKTLSPGVDCAVPYEVYREYTSFQSDLEAGEWQHVAVSYDGTAIRFFVNGIMTETKSYPTSDKYMIVPTQNDIVVGGDYDGSIYDFAIYTKAVTSTSEMQPLAECLPKASTDLAIYLPMNEGIGSYVTQYAGGAFKAGQVVTPAWVSNPCSTYGASASTTEVAGTALTEMLAGQCGLFTIMAHDKCGSKLKAGGDNYTVEIIGPLHTHTKQIELTVGSGITDLGDGSYLANVVLDLAGFYKIYVKLDGVDVVAEGFKTYVHPYVTDATNSFIFDDADTLGIAETEFSYAGVPVAYTLQTVDAFGNIRQAACDVDDPAVEFFGPSPFEGTVIDNYDGTYNVIYTAKVAGEYRMKVTTSDGTVCSSGGYSCSGGQNSAYEYCSLHTPATGGGCEFCVTVYEGSSLALSQGLFATFPDSDELDLTSTFTISAFIKKAVNTGTGKEYIVDKQSEYSGKGYWFAIEGSGFETSFDLEAGIYIGSDTFRIAKATISMPLSTWTHVSVSYSGTEIVLSMDGAEVGKTTFDDAKFQRRSSQPLEVGRNFNGDIDNVMIYSGASPSDVFEASQCPRNVNGSETSLVGYYRFNEGKGYVTKDSSMYDSDGVIGLVCDMSLEGKNVALTCPSGYTMTEILFANFGENDGGCGNYIADCANAGSMTIVEDACLNQNTCTVRADHATFGNECRGTIRSLAVNAVCTKDGVTSVWRGTPSPAPTHVGELSLSEPLCPYGANATAKLPASLQMTGDCAAWDLDVVTAGVTQYFAAEVFDGCGYPGYIPDSTPDVLGISAELGFTAYTDAALGATCGHITVNSPAALAITQQFGGEGQACNRHSDIYLFSYTPSTATDATLKITTNSATLLETAVSVVSGPMAAATSVATGHLEKAEAGVSTTVTIAAKDALGNAVDNAVDYSTSFIYTIAKLSGGKAVATAPTASVHITKEEGAQTYTFRIVYPDAGTYELALYLEDDMIAGFPATIVVSEPSVRKVQSYGSSPSERFEHTMAADGSDVYVFGGAAKDKTYLAETWKWSTGSVADDWKYKRTIALENVAGAYNVEFDIDTADMISRGALKADCSDITFFTDAGVELEYFMVPAGAPYGCGTQATTVYVHVPHALASFDMLYGNYKASTAANPGIFEFFEDFEHSVSSSLFHAYTMETDECQPAGDSAAFTVSDDVSVTGSQSLKVDAETTIGGSLKKATPSMTQFRLKYFFFDVGCEGIHFLSPDFQACTSLGNTKVDSDAGSALGVYSASTPDKYAIASPWKATSQSRAFGFHEFSFVDGTDGQLYAYVDKALVAVEPGTTLDKIFIRGAPASESGSGSVGYYDTIIATSYDPNVEAIVGAEQAVSYNPLAKWKQVGLGASPPARVGHTAVVYGDGFYVFGGERSSYEYGDVWKYAFADDKWTFVAAKNSSAALGRHGHTAVVYGDAMWVYGGRSPQPVGDFWKYDFTMQAWTEQPSSEGMAARFGHTAVVSGGKMLVHGGYLRDSDELTTEIWSYEFATGEWTKIGPRVSNFDAPYNADPADAIVFPALLASPRFSAVGVGHNGGLYVLGGAGGANFMEELQDLYKFSFAKKEWISLVEATGVSRYDAAGAVVDDVLVVFGGHGMGSFYNDLHYMWIGEEGV